MLHTPSYNAHLNILLSPSSSVLLPTCLQWNMRRAAEAMVAGSEVVVIDNTNLSLYEMRPYVQEGKSKKKQKTHPPK